MSCSTDFARVDICCIEVSISRKLGQSLAVSVSIPEAEGSSDRSAVGRPAGLEVVA